MVFYWSHRCRNYRGKHDGGLCLHSRHQHARQPGKKFRNDRSRFWFGIYYWSCYWWVVEWIWHPGPVLCCCWFVPVEFFVWLFCITRISTSRTSPTLRVEAGKSSRHFVTIKKI